MVQDEAARRSKSVQTFIFSESLMPVRPEEQLYEYREPVGTRPAATVLLLRDAPSDYQVLMTRRSMTASFAPADKGIRFRFCSRSVLPWHAV